jgi:hypothetical protein
VVVFWFLFLVVCCGLCCFWSPFGCWVCLVLGYGVVIFCLHDLVCFVFFLCGVVVCFFWGFFFFKGYGLCGVSQPIDFHCFWGLWGCGVFSKKVRLGFCLVLCVGVGFVVWGVFFFFFFFCIMVVDVVLVVCLFAVTVGWIYIVFSVIFCCLGGNWMKVLFADLGFFFFFFLVFGVFLGVVQALSFFWGYL